MSALCEGLVKRGRDVTVFTTDAGLAGNEIHAGVDGVMRNGVRVVYFRREAGYGINSPELEKAVWNYARDFDLIHVTAIWQRSGPAACRAALRAGVPYVISPRGALGPYSWRRGRIKKNIYYFLRERANLRYAAAFHYTSEREAAECAKFRFGQPSCVAPNPINFREWRRDDDARRVWRARHGISADEFVLLYVGRLHHKKGLDLLPGIIAAFRARNRSLSVRLVLLGPDEDGTAEDLRRRFAAARASQCLMTLPPAPPFELPAVYSAADVFVLPSHHENFGNVAVEAAACGCWVLASEHTAVAADLTALGAGECLPRISEVWVDALINAQRKNARAENRAALQAYFGHDGASITRVNALYHQCVENNERTFSKT